MDTVRLARRWMLLPMMAMLASGCAMNTFTMLLASNPPGAMFSRVDVEGGTSETLLGMAPIEAGRWDYSQINIPAYKLSNGCIYMGEYVATWASGARAKRRVEHCGGTGTSTVTSPRPMNVSGLDEDLRFALQLQQAETQRKQASTQEAALYYQLLFGEDRGSDKEIHCSSRSDGDQINTSCY